jgi:hypothetical protein
MISLQRLATACTMVFIMLNLVSCAMMPLMMGPMLYKRSKNTESSNVNGSVNQLVQESAGALIDNRGPYKQILMGKTEVSDNIIPARKLRLTILQTIRKKDVVQVVDQKHLMTNTVWKGLYATSEHDNTLAVLNVQLYYSAGQVWLSQQLVDKRSNQVFWSGIFSRPMPVTSPKSENKNIPPSSESILFSVDRSFGKTG